MGIPFVRADDLRPAVAEQLSERITRIVAPNPGPFTYTGSGTHLLAGAEETIVIDPGPDHQEHIARLVEKAPKPIRKILITHTHRDHSGGAARLKDLTGAKILAFGPHPSPEGKGSPALDEGGDHSFTPDHLLADGEVIATAGLTVQAVHTPGHISNHLCFALDEEKALFTGDHIMGWATTVVAPPDGDMGDYMRSLDRLLARDDAIYYPTHGAPIEDPKTFVHAVKEHRKGRDRAIIGALEDGPRDVMAIVELVYLGLNPALKVAAALNVEAHLAEHMKSGRVLKKDERFELA